MEAKNRGKNRKSEKASVERKRRVFHRRLKRNRRRKKERRGAVDKTRRNCGNIGVAQIVTASWSNNQQGGFHFFHSSG